MKKETLINLFHSKTNYDLEFCQQIINYIEEFGIINDNNKENLINGICRKFNLKYEEALKVANIFQEIIKEEIKNKIKWPFGRQK